MHALVNDQRLSYQQGMNNRFVYQIVLFANRNIIGPALLPRLLLLASLHHLFSQAKWPHVGPNFFDVS